jgi:site-specific DNA recombinase
MLQKQSTEIRKKIDTLDERFALGEIDRQLYMKFKQKFQEEHGDVIETINNSGIEIYNQEK